MSTPIDSTDETFANDVNDDGITVVDFWASWCGPCKSFAPVFALSAARHPDIVHLKVDADACPGLVQEFSVQAVPTTVVIREGIILGSLAGAMGAPQLDDALEFARAVDMDALRRHLAQQD